MLKDDTRIQLDLYDNLDIERSLRLRNARNTPAIRCGVRRFPANAKSGTSRTRSISITPARRRSGPVRRIPFGKDPAGRPWIFTSCEGRGQHLVAQQGPVARRGRVDGDQRRRAQRPRRCLQRQVRRQERPRRRLHPLGLARNYPINNYDVSVNIGKYEHFVGQARQSHARFLRPAGRSGEGQDAVRPGRTNAPGLPDYFGEYPFKKEATSSSRCPTRAWSTRVPSPTATASRTATSNATGPASASAPLRLHHHPRKRPRMVRQRVRRPTAPTCGSTKAGRPTSNASTSSTCTATQTTSNTPTPTEKSRTSPIIAPRHQRHPAAGHVFQGRALPAHSAQRREQRPQMVRPPPRSFQHFKYQNIMTEDMVTWINQRTA